MGQESHWFDLNTIKPNVKSAYFLLKFRDELERKRNQLLKMSKNNQLNPELSFYYYDLPKDYTLKNHKGIDISEKNEKNWMKMMNVQFVETVDQLSSLATILSECNEIGFDCEMHSYYMFNSNIDNKQQSYCRYSRALVTYWPCFRPNI
jgi:hypothetical protein